MLTASLRRVVALLAAAGVALGVLIAGAVPAGAHAILVSTTPAQGAEVTTAPTQVSLEFTESVGINDRSLQVLDPSGKRVDNGAPRHPAQDDTTVVVPLRSGLPKASYAVVWHVVSADAHPIGGTFSFGYGVAASGAPDSVGGDLAVGVLHGISRFLAFVGLVLLVGGGFFLAVLWPDGVNRRRPRRVVATGWWLVAGSSAALFLLEGPYGAGLGLGDTFSGALLSETLATRYGKLMLVRLLLLALAVPVLRRLHERDRGQVFDLGGLGVTMLLTFSLSQHAGLGIQVPVAVTADALHLAAASVWLGGLVILAVALLWKRQPGELADVLPRWSRVAMVCVVTLVASGAYQTWREVGTLPALWETSYGRLLLGKWGGFVLLVALANAGRLWVRRWTPAPVLVAHAASSVEAVAKGRGRRIAGARPAPADGGGDATEPPAQSVGWLRRSVAAEAAIGAGVLALTALLVNDVPARVSYAPAYEAQVTGQDVSGRTIKVTLDVTTTKAGPETMHAYTYDAQGRVLPFASMTGDLEEAAKGLGPVRFTYANTGPGHGTAPAVVVPGSGRWTLTVQIVTPDGDDYAAATTYTVRS